MMRNRFTERPPAAAAALALICLAGALFVMLFPRPAMAQERSPEELQELAQKTMAMAQPGPEHERLAKLAGTWDMEMKIWPQPGAEPIVVEGVVESKMILGGRFLWQSGKFEAGPFAGESITIIGFDRRAGEYTIVGLDTSGTYWITARGPADADGAGAVLTGTDYDAIFGFDQIYDIVLRFVEEDTLASEIVFKDAVHTRGGGPFKMVETTSRRRR